MPKISANGVDTYYERRGSGPPIVFVHGMATSSTTWQAQIEALAEEYTVVTYDVRGHGRTGGSDRTPYSIELYAEDLDALLTELDIERPVLCGLSMGGAIAQVYAARHPGKVAGLVLADTFTAEPLGVTGRLLFANLRFFGLLDRVVRYKTLNRVQTWVGQRLSPGVAGDRASIQDLMEADPTISHAEFRKIARSVADFPASEFDASRIEVPTVVLYGEHEPSALRTANARLAEAIPGATLQEIPDAGHASNVDNPEAFTAAVRDLLETAFPTGADPVSERGSEAGAA